MSKVVNLHRIIPECLSRYKFNLLAQWSVTNFDHMSVESTYQKHDYARPLSLNSTTAVFLLASDPRDILPRMSVTSRACRRGCHEDATRKLLSWNLSFTKFSCAWAGDYAMRSELVMGQIIKIKVKEAYSSLFYKHRTACIPVGSHRVTCHPAEAAFSPLPRPVLDLYTN